MYTKSRLLSTPSKFKSPEPYLSKYKWDSIVKSKLRSPYSENTPMINPMAGSDVYKLIWIVNLSSKISQEECKDLYFKLSKIKRLKDGYVIKSRINININIILVQYDTIFRFSYSNFSSGILFEDLYCPLCCLSLSNSASMEMHFNNYQHIERYQLARNELHVSHEGPFSEIQQL